MIHSYQKQLKGKSVGVVFGSFAPLHQGHLDLIMRAKKENDGGCIVIVCGFDGDKGEPLMPHKKRYRYVREFFADDELVAVYSINDTEIGIGKYPTGKNINKTDSGAENVKAKKFSKRQWVLSILATIIATFLVGLWLESIGSAQAYTDAATNVLAIFAQLLMIKRYREQWLWWLVIDVLCMKLWFVAGNWCMFAMYIAWTINCIYGWVNWTKMNKVSK